MALVCDVVILAGGKGTRLAGVLPRDLPKPLAPVAGKPFLHWQFLMLAKAGVSRVIVSVGWNAEAVRSVLGSKYLGVQVEYSQESFPLGTGGAMKQALGLAVHDYAVVLNGDTYVDVDLCQLLSTHCKTNSALTMCCAKIDDTSRFGRLELEGNHILSIEEKRMSGPGYVNAGLYAMNSSLLQECRHGNFSFETDFLLPAMPVLKPHAFIVHGVFVDIGVAEDLIRAQSLFPRS